MSDSNLSEKDRSLTLMKWATLLLAPMAAFLWMSPINETLFLWLNSRLVDWFGPSIWGLLTCMGDGFFLFPLGMLLVRNNPAKQQALIIAMIFAALALNISKSVIDATRPLGVLGEALVTVVGPDVKSHSMPSGHSGTIIMLAGLALLFSTKRVAALTLILSALAALSRVAVGAHWPADIFAGAWIGLLCTATGIMISARFEAGFKIRVFYVFLGFIPAFLLPVYHNGFQSIPLVQNAQYILAALSLVLSLSELKVLVGDYSAQRKQVPTAQEKRPD